ncbi:uncharacterized protein LOC143913134 [Arctopsyche grandis]|uniref:uncharacterized protein LOC143913134 n=1 Tax=Arctopsyche grandis TaxID=121162 RepID=UPI00406D7C6D
MEENIFPESCIVKETINNFDFYKCCCCPYMSFSLENIGFHIKSLHLENGSKKKNELANTISITCPGCMGRFNSENFLKKHLRHHHCMSSEEVKKMVICLNMQNIDKNKKNLVDESEINGKKAITLYKNTSPNSHCITQDNKKASTEINCSQVITYVNSLPENSLDNNIFSECHQNICNLDDNVSSDSTYPSSFLLNQTNQEIAPESDGKKQHIIKVKSSISNLKSTGTSNLRKVKHEKLISEQSGYRCGIQNCSVRLLLEKNMSYHKSCHLNGTKELHCPECKAQILTVDTLHTHLWNKHRIDLELYSCNCCPHKTYSFHRLTNVHKKIHSGEKTYVCQICLKIFKNSKQLARHRPIHRKDINSPRKFICKICKRELSTNRLLTLHMRAVHEKIKHYKCKMCNYSASAKTSLTVHARLHTGEKPYECEHCSFKSANNSSYRRHSMTHSLQKNYKCEHCSYSCIQASSIKVHIKAKHPGIKTDLLHACSYCSYTSVNKLNYEAHLFLHQKNNHSKNSVKIVDSKNAINIDVKSTESIDEESPNRSDNNFSNLSNDCNIDIDCVNNKTEQIHTDSNVSNEIFNFNQPIEQSYTPTNISQNIFVRNMTDLTNAKPHTPLESIVSFPTDKHQNINPENPNIPFFIMNSIRETTIKDENVVDNKHQQVLSSDIIDLVSNSEPFLRKKPKISVKSYRILKGSDKTHFSNSKIFTMCKNINSTSTPTFENQNKIRVVEDYTILTKPNVMDFIPNTRLVDVNKSTEDQGK